ncbi:MAG: DUF4382 domain-containing protein [Steroidobacteraceae bacterium]
MSNSTFSRQSLRATFQSRVLCLLVGASAALLGACGGSGGSMSNTTAMTSSGASTAQTCTNCGTAVLTLTDAPGDFLSYIVNVVSLQLTRSDGSVVQTVPATTQVDFAQLVNLSEIISAGQIPSGEYVSVSMTLDYSKATIVVDNGTAGVPIGAANIINGATSKPLAAPNPTQVTLTLTLDPNNHLIITPNVVANLALDFNLADSNSIAPSDTNPVTVTVHPALTASLSPDSTRQMRVRGPFVSADTGASNFVIAVRPFCNATGSSGEVTVGVTGMTAYSINGTNYTGGPGLTALAASTAGTMIVAYGSWDQTTQTFNASSVLAGSSVPGNGHDSLSGNVIARTGNSLTVIDGSMQWHQFGGMAFARQATVLLSSATTVSEQGQSGSFSIADISVGQHIQVLGTFDSTSDSMSSDTTPTLDATAGSVQLILTDIAGTVASTVAGTVTMSLQSIDGHSAANFNFAGTGAAAKQDASAGAYTVLLPAPLAGNPLSVGTPAQFTGFVTPFGAAPPDFNAITTVNYANTSAQLWVGWGWQSGYAMPFSTLSGTELLINPSALKASNVHVIRIGFDTIDPSTLAGGLQLGPDPAATNPQFIVAHLQSWKVDNYSTFGDFTAALMMDLTGSTTVLQLGARGPYATGIMQVDDMAVLLSD